MTLKIMNIELTKEILWLANAINKAELINKPKSKKLKEEFANRILKLIK